MGAWGDGPFENDTAMDMLGNLLDAPEDLRTEFLTKVFQAAGTGDFLETFEAEEAVAGAILVALALNPNLPTPAGVYPEHLALVRSPSPELATLARRALERAYSTTDNGWYEVLDEAGVFQDVIESLVPFRATLDRSP